MKELDERWLEDYDYCDQGIHMPPRFSGLAVALGLGSSLLMGSAADAALQVTVTQAGAPPGQSVWAFSGSASYTELFPGGKFAAGGVNNIEEWKGDGGSDYVKPLTYNNYTPGLISGLIDLTVTSSTGGVRTGTIVGLHIDHDGSGDDFGAQLDGSIDIPLADGDLVSWAGSGVFPVDLANLNTGSFFFSNYGESPTVAGMIYGTLPIEINVQPVPGPLPLLGCGAAFASARRLRRRRHERECSCLRS
ncbi:hypothetical protein NZK33_07750 [Cyanobium sp. FGCU-6]|nr:hypothetical protein [Cyanobium sp. FGCU6]